MSVATLRARACPSHRARERASVCAWGGGAVAAADSCSRHAHAAHWSRLDLQPGPVKLGGRGARLFFGFHHADKLPGLLVLDDLSPR